MRNIREWGVVAALVVLLSTSLTSCVEPQPKSLTLPSARDAERRVRHAMTEFNSVRFQEECASIDSVLQLREIHPEHVPGGIRLKRGEQKNVGDEALREWRPVAGEWVQWAWVAYSLDGDSLKSGVDQFAVDRDAVPQAFHEVAKRTGHAETFEVWSPSVSAFGVRGIPGTIPPYTPVRLQVSQHRSVQDSSWWGGVRRGLFQEEEWLRRYMATLDVDGLASEDKPGVWVKVYSNRKQPFTQGMAVALRIRTNLLPQGAERETDMEWVVGTPDQLVPALEAALLEHATAQTLSVWSISSEAFGDRGVSSVGIPGRTPLRFDVEVIPL